VVRRPTIDSEASVPEVAKAFFDMLRIRRVEEAIQRWYPDQQMRNPVHLCIGQEAPGVGVSTHLTIADQAMSGHRSHGHYLSKGGNLNRMIAELHGKATGCCRGRGGSQHLVDTSVGFKGAAPILASTLSIATGVAWSLARGQRGDVAVAYFGDAAVEEGVFHESLSFASLHRLPIIYVCENNLFSVHSPLEERQPPRPIADLALAHAMPGESIDGNDVRVVASAAGEAIARARAGQGPTLLECRTYRYVGHVGPGAEIDLGYRSQQDVDLWQARDPLMMEWERLEIELSDWRVLEREFENMIELQIQEAYEFAMSSPFPAPEEMLNDVYPAAPS
jgi:TPP-dependent pyruvate/acetoin dehydrogenase alpha subunit